MFNDIPMNEAVNMNVKIQEPSSLSSKPLSAIVDIHDCMIKDALTMVFRLKSNLLGDEEELKEKASPKCFRDMLLMENENLNVLCVKIAEICKEFGV